MSGARYAGAKEHQECHIGGHADLHVAVAYAICGLARPRCPAVPRDLPDMIIPVKILLWSTAVASVASTMASAASTRYYDALEAVEFRNRPVPSRADSKVSITGFPALDSHDCRAVPTM